MTRAVKGLRGLACIAQKTKPGHGTCPSMITKIDSSKKATLHYISEKTTHRVL
jgi:hypothetical protein